MIPIAWGSVINNPIGRYDSDSGTTCHDIEVPRDLHWIVSELSCCKLNRCMGWRHSSALVNSVLGLSPDHLLCIAVAVFCTRFRRFPTALVGLYAWILTRSRRQYLDSASFGFHDSQFPSMFQLSDHLAGVGDQVPACASAGCRKTKGD